MINWNGKFHGKLTQNIIQNDREEWKKKKKCIRKIHDLKGFFEDQKGSQPSDYCKKKKEETNSNEMLLNASETYT